jgi:hypothetical protein
MLAADDSPFCTVHKVDRKLRPREPKPTDHPPDCTCKGTERCHECKGRGEMDCECTCGNIHDAECETCDGTGECQDGPEPPDAVPEMNKGPKLEI